MGWRHPARWHALWRKGPWWNYYRCYEGLNTQKLVFLFLLKTVLVEVGFVMNDAFVNFGAILIAGAYLLPILLVQLVGECFADG